MQIKREQCMAIIIDDQVKLLPAISDSETLLKNTGILIQGLKILDDYATIH